MSNRTRVRRGAWGRAGTRRPAPLSLLGCGAIAFALAGCPGPSDDAPRDQAPPGEVTASDGTGPVPAPTGRGSPGEATGPAATRAPDAGAIAANNRGVGLMGRFDYAAALAVFAGLAEDYPQWADVRVNLAVATLNRQLDGDEQAALALVDAVLRRDPGHLRAHYVAGLLRLYLATPAEALGHFETVAGADPADAYAAYYLGQTLAQLGRPAEALPAFRRAMALDPYLRSAYYGAFQALQRLGQSEEARRIAADYQRLGANPRARLAEFKYTRMGPKGEALVVGLEGPRPPAPLPEGPVFSLPGPLPVPEVPAISPPHGRPASLTAAELDGDGLTDLFLAGVLPGDPPGNLVLAAREEGAYAALPGHPLAAVGEVRAVGWGDLDGDGRVDAYLARRGPNQLWLRTPAGGWRDATAETGTAGADLETVDVAVFDADHDGDLDLFLVNGDGANELLSNNGDGTFRPLAATRGIGGDGRGSRTVVPVDLDRDRDVDLVVLNREPPHAVYLNDRLWEYRPAPGLDDFLAAPALTALAADLDTDGFPEIYTVAPEGPVRRWVRVRDGTYVGETLTRIDAEDGAWAQLGLLDADGDGRLELLTAGPEAWRVLGASGKVLLESAPTDGSPVAAALAWAPGPSRGPAVLALDGAGRLTVSGPGPGRYPFLSLALTGATDSAQSMRSNTSGIGARVSVRVGSRWTVLEGYRAHSGPGQGLGPMAVGLGPEGQADFVAIDWSDGVFQSEIDLAGGTLHRVTETQRQLSSCPVLFAWDGERYAFVTDFLGVGGLGYAVGPGEYAEPRPRERILLPEGLARPRDRRYALKLTEPMEEAAYLDNAALVVYDLPPGWQMLLDERMATGGPVPTGAAHFYRRELQPARAHNGRGETVTDTVMAADGAAAPVGPTDRRYIGRLKDEEVLTLAFPTPLDAGPGEPWLVADGWVEYPYSQTSFAAWQAGARYDPPTLEARGGDGRWVAVLPGFGYPAGMPRRMAVPLGMLPPGTTGLRLRTTMEVYWDRLAVAFVEPAPEATRHPAPLTSARLAAVGFPRRTDGPQRRPDYDYARRAPFWDTRYQEGLYTRFGPVEDLLAAADDAVVVLGPGEEVHVEIEAPPDGPRPGWTRRLVLETRGWTKDMDLYTKDGETVDPLPSSGRATGPRDELHARYNTRWMGGR